MAYQYPKDDWPLDEKALGTEFVTVQVGKQKEEVAFHKKLLSSRSTAFEHHMKVLKEKGKYQFHCEARFENAFSILVTYLYKGYVPSCPIEDGPESSSYGRQMRELYYLAERFEIIDLMDKTMDAIQYDAFTCIALYACHGKVPTAPKDIDPVYTRRLRWIYYVAEEFALHDLMNKLIDELRVYEFKHKQEIHFHAEEIYRNTSKGSLLRWYSAASAAWSWGRETGPATASQRDNRKKFISAGRENPDVFADFHLVDLFHRDHIRGFDTDWRDFHDSGSPVCTFHCHAPGETCHRTGITEPAEVPEHISKSFDGIEDAVLLERSQVMDISSDQDIRSSARPSTPPESSEAEADVRQMEDPNMRSDAGHDTTLSVAEHETILPSVGEPNGVMNDAQETGNHTTATASKVREVEEGTKASPTVSLASIRNPPSTRVVPSESKKNDRQHKATSTNLENDAPAEDNYGTSDVDMDLTGNQPSVVQDSDTESSEEDSSELSTER
ncbi:predicted protein [Sclerotinia sclerotiorum 1980 UF-70]|uniref:BTB domain-containing protein n=1 Tax=Sclerotinia sclerotiorum (strain ATCC 18683 / 1980 / Ss-1) TaxID=665079 RepID=A7EUY9_SCLS1|nr:predicted protein [Sclerotinia sclerotiorum 1980 UF-70]EDN93281.1 predicted protein [Sclerotinia sclerotiorum 1980 UF-70]